MLLFSEMNEHSILVYCDLSLLPVYLLQQQRTGISTSAQVRWISSTSIFSSPTDLSPPCHWCRVNDECLNIKATTTTFHGPVLFYFSPQTSQTRGWIKSRQVCESVVYTSAKSPKGHDFARTVRLQSYGHCSLWMMILWGGANGRSMARRQQMHINGTGSCVWEQGSF